MNYQLLSKQDLEQEIKTSIKQIECGKMDKILYLSNPLIEDEYLSLETIFKLGFLIDCDTDWRYIYFSPVAKQKNLKHYNQCLKHTKEEKFHRSWKYLVLIFLYKKWLRFKYLIWDLRRPYR